MHNLHMAPSTSDILPPNFAHYRLLHLEDWDGL